MMEIITSSIMLLVLTSNQNKLWDAGMGHFSSTECPQLEADGIPHPATQNTKNELTSCSKADLHLIIQRMNNAKFHTTIVCPRGQFQSKEHFWFVTSLIWSLASARDGCICSPLFQYKMPNMHCMFVLIIKGSILLTK